MPSLFCWCRPALLVRLAHGQYVVLHVGVSLPAKIACVGTDGSEMTALAAAAGKADTPAFQGGYYHPRSSAVPIICFGSVPSLAPELAALIKGGVS